jgi:hypothetical protein
MEEGDNRLVKKILWAYIVDDKEETPLRKLIIDSCKKLEDFGFGMLENANNPGKIDISCSVISPDGSIFTPEQINDYWMKRGGGFNSENPEDMKMHNINMYYFGFKEIFRYIGK